jgi:presenilin-like A22 family membrane protease
MHHKPKQHHERTKKTKRLNTKLKAPLTLQAPILASLLLAFLCTILIMNSQVETFQVTPFSDETNPLGPFGNALYFVILVATGATVLYLLLKRKNRKLITILISLALTLAVFTLSLIYSLIVLSQTTLPSIEILALIIAICLTAIADYGIFSNKNKLSSLTLLTIGGSLGAFLAFTVPIRSTIAILILLAIYDTFAVYRGPVGKIASSGLEQLRGLTFSFRDIQIGLGDLTFYSMLVSSMLMNFGPVSSIASTIGILLGAVLSFKLLEKRGIFPGLPIPIALGLTIGILVSVLQI